MLTEEVKPNNRQKQIFYIIMGLIFVIGFLVRTIVLGYRHEFEDDECRLLIALSDKSFWQLFFSIGYAQSAPPFYLILLKFWAFLFKENEMACHILPYFFSLGSIFYFYKLSEKFFIKKFSLILANLLFSINCFIVHFSSIIKQYSSDVFICLVMAFYMHNIDLCKIDRKKYFLLICLFILLPFVSLPSVFFIGALFFVNFIKNYRNKSFYIKAVLMLLPFLVVMLLYYFYNLAPSKIDFDTMFPDYWRDGFIYSCYDFIHTIVYNLLINFYPNTYILFQFILFFLGFYFCAKEKSTLSKYYILVFLLCIIVAALKLYPFMGRVCLFAVPMFIFFIVKPLDYTVGKKMWCFVAVILLLAFGKYNIGYFTNILLNDAHYNIFRAKSFVSEMMKSYNPDTDTIIVNSASMSTFIYYSQKFGFKPIDVMLVHTKEDIPASISKSNFKAVHLNNIFDNLENDKRYFICLFKDYQKAPIFEKMYSKINSSNVYVIKSASSNKSKLMLVKKKI